MKQKIENSIAFAYFVDGMFIGWYADTFGSVRKSPKLYNASEKQIAVIRKNFNYKLKKISESSFKEELIISKNIAEALKTLTFDSEELLRGRKVILKMVRTPFYDGPNPDYVRSITKLKHIHHVEMYHVWCKEMELKPGIEPGTNFGIALIDNYKRYDKIYPEGNSNYWIYMDYSLVNTWAETAPTEFIDEIIPD